MSEKERQNENVNPGGCPDGTPAGGANLAQARQEGSALLAAADEAITLALSGDSTKFNQSARQEGGQ